MAIYKIGTMLALALLAEACGSGASDLGGQFLDSKYCKINVCSMSISDAGKSRGYDVFQYIVKSRTKKYDPWSIVIHYDKARKIRIAELYFYQGSLRYGPQIDVAYEFYSMMFEIKLDMKRDIYSCWDTVREEGGYEKIKMGIAPSNFTKGSYIAYCQALPITPTGKEDIIKFGMTSSKNFPPK